MFPFNEYKNEDIELTWTTVNGLEMCYDNSPSCSVGVSAMGTLAVVKCGVGDEERALCILIEDRGADIFAEVDASKEAREATLEEIVSAITVKKIERPRMDREEVKEIADLLMRNFVKRVKQQMDIDLRYSEAVKNYIFEKGYDKKYGARPLKRAIQNEIEDKLAEEILMGNIRAGQTVRISIVKTGVKFKAI